MNITRIQCNNMNTVKQALGHVVEHRAGYQSELKTYGKEVVEDFKTLGLINGGQTMKADTYGVTKLGDAYYRDVFGTFNYAYHRVKGWVNRIL